MPMHGAGTASLPSPSPPRHSVSPDPAYRRRGSRRMSASRLEIGPSWPAGLARRSPTSIPRAVGRRLAGRAPPARDPGADRSNVPNPARAPEHECRPQGRRGQQVAPRAGRDYPARFTFGDGGSPTASAPPYCIPTATPTDLAASHRNVDRFGGSPSLGSKSAWPLDAGGQRLEQRTGGRGGRSSSRDRDPGPPPRRGIA